MLRGVAFRIYTQGPKLFLTSWDSIHAYSLIAYIDKWNSVMAKTLMSSQPSVCNVYY